MHVVFIDDDREVVGSAWKPMRPPLPPARPHKGSKQAAADT